MGVEEDLLLLVVAGLAFTAGMIGTQRLFRWFVVPSRWRIPGLTEPS